jgi:transposase-like protein
MQQLVRLKLSPQDYLRTDPHNVVPHPDRCRLCGHAHRLHRHGTYSRGLLILAKVVAILVARFRCPQCRRTTSLLPDFALSYRLLPLALVDAFFRASAKGRSRLPRADLLARYRRRWQRWWPTLHQHIGCLFGRIRTREPCAAWVDVGHRAGGMAAANRTLVEQVSLSLFGRYVIHAR